MSFHAAHVVCTDAADGGLPCQLALRLNNNGVSLCFQGDVSCSYGEGWEVLIVALRGNGIYE